MVRVRIPLALRIAGVFSLFIILLLSIASAIISLRLGSTLRAYFGQDHLRIAEARAAQISELIDKVSWSLHISARSTDFQYGDGTLLERAVMALEGTLPAGIVGAFYTDTEGNFYTMQGDRGNVAERDYFDAIVNQGKPTAIGEAVVSKSLGLPLVVFAEEVKGIMGDLKGFLSYQVSLDTLSEMVSAVSVGTGGFGWISDSSGMVLAHPNRDLLMTRSTDGLTGASSQVSDLNQAMVSHEQGTVVWKNGEGERITTYFVHIEKTPGWVFAVSVPTTEINAPVYQVIRSLLVIVLFAVAAAAGISLLIGRSVVKPLRAVGSVFKTLASGDADLTVSLPRTRDDEVGDLTRDFNAFLTTLRSIVLGLRETQGELAGIGTELSEGAASGASSSSQLAAGSESVRKLVMAQSEKVESSSAALEQIVANIEALDRRIATQASGVEEASASIEQMIGNIGAVTASVDKIADRFGLLEASAGEGREVQESASARIAEIVQRSAALMEANEVIAGIASQTNLLAMNAAIEAAHAGEAGKGFSVVADEIRRLAETSTEQSRTIGGDLGAIRDAITQVVESSAASDEAFSKVSDQISELTTLVREVHNAMTEQRQGSSQVLEALRDLEGVTLELRDGSREMNTGTEVILADVASLRSTTREISESVEGVAVAARSVSSDARRLTENSARTRTAISHMEASIGRFKV